MQVTIFGGTKPRPGETEYDDAVQLGRLLAESGHTVITGGYMGTMEAVSRGANEFWRTCDWDYLRGNRTLAKGAGQCLGH